MRKGHSRLNSGNLDGSEGNTSPESNETQDETPTEPATESLTLLHDTHVGGRLGTAGADDDENIESYFGLMADLAEPDRTLRLGAGETGLAQPVIDRIRERTPISPETEGRIARL